MQVLKPILLSATFIAASPVASAEKQPNVIIIFCDDLGYADIGPFGASAYTTPNLDRMAREGRSFTNFHVSQPVCSASRASLLTGCYSNRIGIHGALNHSARHGINPLETTLAEIFKQERYATGMAGKWHLGHLPEFLPSEHGFDESLFIPYSNDMWPHHPAPGNVTYPPLPMIEGKSVVDASISPEEQAQFTARFTDRAVDFIERNKDRPFFFYLAHPMPHVPLFASDRFAEKSGAGTYGDVIQEIDWSVGQVLDALKSHGVDDKTLVIFTSDNGPWLAYGNHSGNAAPLREGKGTSWEGGTRVPCIMRWPDKIPAGTRSSDMLMTIDLLPTLAKQIEANPPEKKIDGLDVWPLIEGKPGAKNPHDAYWSYFANNQLQAVTSGDGRWKLILPHSYRTLGGSPAGKDGLPGAYAKSAVKSPELYDLNSDVSERKDVAGQHPEIVERLMASAEAARAELGDSLSRKKGAGIREPGRAD